MDANGFIKKTQQLLLIAIVFHYLALKSAISIFLKI
mgnify:CR=1 FL=1